MSLVWKRFTVYARILLVLALAVAINLVLAENRANAVSFWFFGWTDVNRPINVVWLMLYTAAATLVVRWTLLLGWGLWRDMREIQRLQEVQNIALSQQKRMTDLEARQRQLDETAKRLTSGAEDKPDGITASQKDSA